ARREGIRRRQFHANPRCYYKRVTDALGRDDISLPLNLQRVWTFANGHNPTAKSRPGISSSRPAGWAAAETLTGSGEITLLAPVQEVWRRLLDPNELAAIIPGCSNLTQDQVDRYSARVTIGIGAIRGTYHAQIELRDKSEGSSLRLVGKAVGPLGFGA